MRAFYANNDLIVEERKVVQSTQIWRQTFFFRELEVMDISALWRDPIGKVHHKRPDKLANELVFERGRGGRGRR